jgi:hypothetical protein
MAIKTFVTPSIQFQGDGTASTAILALSDIQDILNLSRFPASVDSAEISSVSPGAATVEVISGGRKIKITFDPTPGNNVAVAVAVRLFSDV